MYVVHDRVSLACRMRNFQTNEIGGHYLKLLLLVFDVFLDHIGLNKGVA